MTYVMTILFVVEVELEDTFVVDVVDVFEVVGTLVVVFEVNVLLIAPGRHWPRQHNERVVLHYNMGNDYYSMHSDRHRCYL